MLPIVGLEEGAGFEPAAGGSPRQVVPAPDFKSGGFSLSPNPPVRQGGPRGSRTLRGELDEGAPGKPARPAVSSGAVPFGGGPVRLRRRPLCILSIEHARQRWPWLENAFCAALDVVSCASYNIFKVESECFEFSAKGHHPHRNRARARGSDGGCELLARQTFRRSILECSQDLDRTTRQAVFLVSCGFWQSERSAAYLGLPSRSRFRDHAQQTATKFQRLAHGVELPGRSVDRRLDWHCVSALWWVRSVRITTPVSSCTTHQMSNREPARLLRCA